MTDSDDTCGQPWVAEIEKCPRCGKDSWAHRNITRHHDDASLSVEHGTWTVWGDGTTPILKDVSYAAMKTEVDRRTQAGEKDVYGDDSVTATTYPE